MKNGFAKLVSAGLGLSLMNRRPDCQPEYGSDEERRTGSSRHSYCVRSLTRGSL
jgi:hypothetical protein